MAWISWVIWSIWSIYSLFLCLFLSLWISTNRPSRTEQRVADRAHPGEHHPRPAAPPVVQPPRQHLTLSQAAAETGRPAAAGDGARGAGPGDQQDGGRFTPPASAGDLQGHVLTLKHRRSQHTREIPLSAGQEIKKRGGKKPGGNIFTVRTCCRIEHCRDIIG